VGNNPGIYRDPYGESSSAECTKSAMTGEDDDGIEVDCDSETCYCGDGKGNLWEAPCCEYEYVEGGKKKTGCQTCPGYCDKDKDDTPEDKTRYKGGEMEIIGHLSYEIPGGDMPYDIYDILFPGLSWLDPYEEGVYYIGPTNGDGDGGDDDANSWTGCTCPNPLDSPWHSYGYTDSCDYDEKKTGSICGWLHSWEVGIPCRCYWDCLRWTGDEFQFDNDVETTGTCELISSSY
jgi:hypothetical protein